ncbi:hypothetical protein B0T22DRAFT_437909 [Podospora appendiculata]|uniref:G-patch domain-containing protein n=1 Tax=Podospora appendiculata TaxID=314037 RepID=A0AAE0XK53_9PEZI|nr:hypothetical protein B0T22DRAFT_437909 [Podospora appendiculata]
MDASALLKSQGWRGKGFSLHPTDSTIGLAKPLMLSRNTDGRGIGQKAHYTSDQWWLDAFDQKLKGLDTTKKGLVTQSTTTGKLDVIASGQPNSKYSGAKGLYSSFVRGEPLVGTVDRLLTDISGETSSTDATPDPGRLLRAGETKEERQARRIARRIRKAEKMARKTAKARLKRKAAEKKAKEKAKKARQAGGGGGDETREERRARRAERRERKEAKRRKAGETSARKPDQG